ncbi:MAG: DNA repair protein RecN [Actinobacteria bacterium]|nr:DNA repair protein RecN [Actinomycetota bacterium]
MLTELSVTNYAVIDRLRLSVGPGFNVLTGETGAGKSIILGALGLLLGERADTSAIRSDADRAFVEGVFELDEPHVRRLEEILGAEVEDGVLILSREVTAAGRNVCRVNSRTVPRKLLQDIGAHLVDIHGQSEHLSLLKPGEQRDLLDRYGGLTEMRTRFATLSATIGNLRRDLRQSEQERREVAQHLELMEYQAREIETAGLKPGEEESLSAERSVMVNAQALAQMVSESCAGLDADEAPEPGAVQMLSVAVRVLSSMEQLDPAAGQMRQRAESISVQIEELVRDLRDYGEAAIYDPRRLAEVEERLEVIATLKRKYGPTVEDVIAFGDDVSGRLMRAEGSVETEAQMQRDLQDTCGQAATLAVELDAARAGAAARLSKATEEQLKFLGLESATMAAAIRHRREAGGLPPGDGPFVDYEISSGTVSETGLVQEPVKFSSTGAAEVEFLISTNPGEPPKPLASVASGGESSRLMLAIKTALAEVDNVPTLVFDEIDAGIGGRTGEAVGVKLAALGRRHQVLAVTHLPQIASHGQRHFSARKVVQDGRTSTCAVEVEGSERLEEITRMLGSETDATRQKAKELLTQASEG